MQNIKTDILISGAGPAGATISHFLSKNKIPHLIIDKAAFPRDKICGDALSGKVVDIIKKLDETWLDEMVSDKNAFLHSSGVSFVSPAGDQLDIPFKSSKSTKKGPIGFIASRLDFDNFLVKKINKKYATFLEGTSFLKAEKNTDNSWKVDAENNEGKFAISCKIILACDGDRSFMAKNFGGKTVEPEHYCAGIRAYYEGVEGLNKDGFIELHFVKDFLPGYLWIFPMSNGRANVGAGILSKYASKNKVNLKQDMLKMLETNPAFSERFKNAKLTDGIKGYGLPLASKKWQLSGDGFILCGDSGSMIDPFTGEGIGNAMIAAKYAAEITEKAIKENNFSAEFLSVYDKKVNHHLGPEFKLSHTLQKLSKYQWLFNSVVKKAIKNSTLRDTISCMFDDMDLRKQFSNPKFYFKILFGK